MLNTRVECLINQLLQRSRATPEVISVTLLIGDNKALELKTAES